MATVIITHGGAADHINLHGLIRHYASIVPDKLIVMSQGNCEGLIAALYEDLPNVFILTDRNMYPTLYENDNYLINVSGAKYLIRVGFYLFEYTYYAIILKHSFLDSFYLSKNLDPTMRYTNFKIPPTILEESKLIYQDFIKKHGTDYILIHEDPNHSIINGFKYGDKIRNTIIPINKKFIKTDLPIINLDQISNKMIDYFDVLLNAKEIHLIHSSWSNLLYILNFNEEKLKSIPIYMHFYSRENKDYCLYEPKHSNWTYLKSDE